ncbi:MAG: transposase [Chloroflexi bacterium]|nr:transposase [Chloroflexota bacterium]
MPFDPQRHHRRSIRLPSYDYTQPGAYFITVCAHDKASLFGDVLDGDMRMNTFGYIVQEEWERTARAREDVTLDAFIVMPNHTHAIIWLTGHGDTAERGGMARHAPTVVTPPTPRFGRPIADSLATVVGAFKSATSRRINKLRGTPASPVWQRNYYERVVRGEDDLHGIQEYIAANPAQWAQDPENPSPSQEART